MPLRVLALRRQQIAQTRSLRALQQQAQMTSSAGAENADSVAGERNKGDAPDKRQPKKPDSSNWN